MASRECESQNRVMWRSRNKAKFAIWRTSASRDEVGDGTERSGQSSMQEEMISQGGRESKCKRPTIRDNYTINCNSIRCPNWVLSVHTSRAPHEGYSTKMNGATSLREGQGRRSRKSSNFFDDFRPSEWLTRRSRSVHMEWELAYLDPWQRKCAWCRMVLHWLTTSEGSWSSTGVTTTFYIRDVSGDTNGSYAARRCSSKRHQKEWSTTKHLICVTSSVLFILSLLLNLW